MSPCLMSYFVVAVFWRVVCNDDIISVVVCWFVLQRVFVMPNMDDIPVPLLCAHLPPDADDNVTPASTHDSAT